MPHELAIHDVTREPHPQFNSEGVACITLRWVHPRAAISVMITTTRRSACPLVTFRGYFCQQLSPDDCSLSSICQEGEGCPRPRQLRSCDFGSHPNLWPFCEIYSRSAEELRVQIRLLARTHTHTHTLSLTNTYHMRSVYIQHVAFFFLFAISITGENCISYHDECTARVGQEILARFDWGTSYKQGKAVVNVFTMSRVQCMYCLCSILSVWIQCVLLCMLPVVSDVIESLYRLWHHNNGIMNNEYRPPARTSRRGNFDQNMFTTNSGHRARQG